MPDGLYGGIVQYDLGKATEHGFQPKGFLTPVPTTLRCAIDIMRSNHLITGNKVDKYLSQMLQKSERLSIYARPSANLDILFKPDYRHVPSESTCAKCDRTKVVARTSRASILPEIHYGVVGSGDLVVKSDRKRDTTAQHMREIVCFEMEAAGIATEFSCIVIRGISDYADSHKNDDWSCYAAAAAAACAKELLELLSYLGASAMTNGLAVQQQIADFDNMKKSLMRDLQNRCERVVELEVSLDEAREKYNGLLRSSIPMRQTEKKITLLERNVEQMTKLLRRFTEENSALKKEVARAERRLAHKDECIKSLEILLEDSKERRETMEHIYEMRLQTLHDLKSIRHLDSKS